jgi:hypothetical protein
MSIQRRRTWAYRCVCERCGHRWTSYGETAPRACAGCKATNWNREARVYRRRKPKRP